MNIDTKMSEDGDLLTSNSPPPLHTYRINRMRSIKWGLGVVLDRYYLQMRVAGGEVMLDEYLSINRCRWAFAELETYLPRPSTPSMNRTR